MRFRYQSGAGARAFWIYLESRGSQGSTPAVGLAEAPDEAALHYIRDDLARPERLEVTADEDRDGDAASLVEVDRERLPGIYRLTLPAVVFEPGSASVVIALCFGHLADREVEPLALEVELTAYDPYDGVGIGLDGFTKGVRHQNLTSILTHIMPDSVRALARERRRR